MGQGHLRRQQASWVWVALRTCFSSVWVEMCQSRDTIIPTCAAHVLSLPLNMKFSNLSTKCNILWWRAIIIWWRHKYLTHFHSTQFVWRRTWQWWLLQDDVNIASVLTSSLVVVLWFHKQTCFQNNSHSFCGCFAKLKHKSEACNEKTALFHF